AVVAAVSFVLFFPAERVGALAAERASEALDRDVAVASFGVRILPAPAVSLAGVRIAGHTRSDARGGQEPPPLAEIERVEIRPRLLPLLRRQVEVHSIVVQRPVIVMELDSAAVEPEPPEDEGPGLWDESTVRIRSFRIEDGVIEV